MGARNRKMAVESNMCRAESRDVEGAPPLTSRRASQRQRRRGALSSTRACPEAAAIDDEAEARLFLARESHFLGCSPIDLFAPSSWGRGVRWSLFFCFCGAGRPFARSGTRSVPSRDAGALSDSQLVDARIASQVHGTPQQAREAREVAGRLDVSTRTVTIAGAPPPLPLPARRLQPSGDLKQGRPISQVGFCRSGHGGGLFGRDVGRVAMAHERILECGRGGGDGAGYIYTRVPGARGGPV